MAIRYHGEPITVTKPEDAAGYLARTALLPDNEYEGGVLRFMEEFGGNRFWIYYMVTNMPRGGRSCEIRRLIGMDGDNPMLDVPPATIREMSNSNVRSRVTEIKNRYRNDPILIRFRGEAEREKRGLTRIRGKFDGTIAHTV